MRDHPPTHRAKKRLFLSTSRTSNLGLGSKYPVKVAVGARALTQLLALQWGTSSEVSPGLGGRSSLPTFTQQACPQTVLEAWVPVREVVAASQ